MSFPDIRELVPHSGAMVLLDRVLSADAENLCAEVAIHAGSVFYDAPSAGVGSWVGIEYMAQAIAAHAGYLARLAGAPVKIGFLLGARRYEAQLPLFVNGSVLQVHVQQALQGENGLGAFECRIEMAGAVLAQATITVFQPEDAKQFLQESMNGAQHE
ncbi:MULTISPECIES: hotdog family protein [unclassified Janthinobacterium]|uniref:hotdog family protein n=1 Tax=unclassified Janthinobacterium TaxID=2610881 RepID=UPI001E509494|nr:MULTISPECIES: hotdog family protein [unclassified Janthinobacterium]MCC7643768.1 hotdog family protein [Janthinobacterium sp. EB271-G4-3-1]MCC7691079.1 hotdog family protein [Janthinobacterium sp. EB271-G4-3-2]